MAQRATSLGPKPSLFVISFFCFFSFPSLLFNTWKVFPPEKGIFCLFLSLSLCFSLAFFGLPLFQFLFLCLSLSLSISLPLSLVLFHFFFLLVFLFLLSFGSFFLSLSFLLFLLCFCFVKGTTSKHSIAIFFINLFCLFLVSCLVFSFEYLFLMFVFFYFSVFKLCFWFNMNVFGFKTNKNTHFWSRGGLQQNVFLFITCVLQNVKSYRFSWGPFFWQILVGAS